MALTALLAAPLAAQTTPGSSPALDPIGRPLPATSAAHSAAPWEVAVGWDDNDFLIAGFFTDNIAVYDENFVFKGTLDAAFNGVVGLDFTSSGTLVAAGHGGEVREYDSSGALVNSFLSADLGFPVDGKIGPSDLYYVGTQTGLAVREFDLSGASIRSFGIASYRGVAVLPGGVLWADEAIGATIDVFDIGTGAPAGTVLLDNGQSTAASMFYSAVSDTVLATDIGSGRVFERTTAGAFVRVFDPGVFSTGYGVTRGPGGDVFATDCNRNSVFRWQADGTFLGEVPLPELSCPVGIVWTGNVSCAAAAKTVAVFDNPAYVDTLGGASSESDTVQASLVALGHTVFTFTGITAADFTAAAAASDVVLFPEFENGDLNADLDAAARAAIAAAVAGGKGVVVMGQFSWDISFLNGVFGYALTIAGGVGPTDLDAGQAAGTAFAAGPASLPPHSFTSGVDRASLPAVALDLYHDAAENSVFAAPFGAGKVARLGWDWFNAQPLGIQDGGWLDVLDRTLTHLVCDAAAANAADLAIAKDDGVTQVDAGGSTTYTLEVGNLGGIDVVGAAVTDLFPPELSCTWTCAPSGGASCTAGPVAGDLVDTVDLPAGDSVTYTAVCDVAPGAMGTLTNTAEVMPPAGVTDPDPSNNSATDVDAVLRPSLSLAKDDGGITATPGSVVVYALTAGNALGAGTAIGVTLSDTVPAATTFDEAGSGGAGVWSCPDGSPPGTVCARSLPDIPAGGSQMVAFAVAVDDPAPAGLDLVSNTATVAAANGDPAMASDTTPVDAAPDLAIAKDDGGVTVQPGQTYAYTLTWANNGNQGATGVVLTETVPADTSSAVNPGWEVAPVGSAVPCDGQPAGTVCVFSVGGVAGGGAGGATSFALTVDSPYGGDGVIDNTASVADDGSNGPDPNPADNQDSDATPLGLDFGDAPLPDYPTLLSADGARHVAHSGITLGALIDAEGDGQPTPGADGDDLADLDDEDGVVFVAPLLAGTTVAVDVTASAAGLLNAWVDFNADGDWSDAGEQVFGDQPLAPGVNSLAVAVPFAAAPGTSFARFRFASAGGLGVTGFAPDGEVEDHAVEIVAEADLALAKGDVFDPLMAGKTQVFRVTVTNNGPSLATGLMVEDTLPAGVWFLTAEPPAPQCLEAGGLVTCELSDLDPGASTDVRLVVRVDAETVGTITNSATVFSAVPDPDPANDAASEESQVLPLRAMKALPDVNGNGTSDIAALEAGSLVVRVFDAGTGAVISGAVFQPDFAPIALTTVPSFANSPAPEVVVLARRTTDGLVGVFARDALSGALVATHYLPAEFRPLHLAAVPNFGGTPAWEVAVLGRRDSDGLVRVTVLDARSGAVLRAYNQSLQFFPIGFLPVPDFSGNGAWELATVGRRAVNQALRVRMHDASTGALVSQWLTDHTFQPTGFGVVTDVNGDGSADVAILGRRNPDGAVREWTRDSRTGAVLALFGYPAAWLPLDLGIVPDFAGPLFDEGAALRWRPSDGDVRVTLKDTSNGAFLAGRLFDPSFFPLDLEIVPSFAGGPADELAVWSERLSDGRQRIYLVDPASGADLGFVPVP